MKTVRSFALLSLGALAFLIAPSANAQITREIRANIPFSFYVQDTRLPAGSYTLNMLDDSDLQVMQIRSQDGKDAVVFDVDDTQQNSTPSTTELIFHRYGSHEYLSRIFESGSADGSRVVSTRSEMAVQKDGAKSQEHALHAQ